MFPLSCMGSFKQWWSCEDTAVNERKVLSCVPFLPPLPTNSNVVDVLESAANLARAIKLHQTIDSHRQRRWELSRIKLSGEDRSINELYIEQVGEEVQNTLVMLHGYGAGLAFWYKNYEALSRPLGWRLYSLDLLGMGRSSRPPFQLQAKDEDGKIVEAENWFIDALEEWRKQRGIERFTLMAHSLGGYMAVAYALKYPGHLKKLILVSPAGMSEDPNTINERIHESAEKTSTMNDSTQHRDEETSASVKDASILLETDICEVKASPNTSEWHYPKWLAPLWDAKISPFTVLRWTGPFGPKIVSGWTSRRFSHLPTEEARALHDYSYSLFIQPSSGEHALACILTPRMFARRPLIRRIQDVGRQYFQRQTTGSGTLESSHCASLSTKMERENGYPIVFFYGEDDWMDKEGGFAAQQKVLGLKRQMLKFATPEEKHADEGDAKVIIVPKAGHIVYLDGWEYFNRKVTEEMEGVSQREKERP
ncbi:alpha/beta-hydrolase [Mollisia scopiformis]|uniref:Alpha/beta-hydrolase n=1 Tax=Mollisia scopiformis TaxID=149040 RepID=A0A194XBF0_MOLSC|nr:alpha/beta-hydrolase [Mollisia scopiformis]KUJ17488.1 alpha/beta-hydrolase [Mollisia scopiformis]